MEDVKELCCLSTEFARLILYKQQDNYHLEYSEFYYGEEYPQGTYIFEKGKLPDELIIFLTEADPHNPRYEYQRLLWDLLDYEENCV